MLCVRIITCWAICSVYKSTENEASPGKSFYTKAENMKRKEIKMRRNPLRLSLLASLREKQTLKSERILNKASQSNSDNSTRPAT